MIEAISPSLWRRARTLSRKTARKVSAVAIGAELRGSLASSLLVARRTVLNVENVVRAILREAGVKLGTPSRAAFVDRVGVLAGGDTLVMPLVEPLLAISPRCCANSRG